MHSSLSRDDDEDDDDDDNDSVKGLLSHDEIGEGVGRSERAPNRASFYSISLAQTVSLSMLLYLHLTSTWLTNTTKDLLLISPDGEDNNYDVLMPVCRLAGCAIVVLLTYAFVNKHSGTTSISHLYTTTLLVIPAIYFVARLLLPKWVAYIIVENTGVVWVNLVWGMCNIVYYEVQGNEVYYGVSASFLFFFCSP